MLLATHHSAAPSHTRSLLLLLSPIPTMNDFDGLFSDFGLKPQGKSAPMAPPSKGSSNADPLNFDFGSSRSASTFDDLLAGAGSGSDTHRADSPFDLDSMYGGPPARSTSSPPPVYDKPVYDDDIFDGVPGMKTTSKVRFDDVFATTESGGSAAAFDDIFGGFGKEPKSSGGKRSEKDAKGASDFDDLLAGFGHSRAPSSGRYIYMCVCELVTRVLLQLALPSVVVFMVLTFYLMRKEVVCGCVFSVLYHAQLSERAGI